MTYSAALLPSPVVEAVGDHLDTYRNKIINGQFDVWQRGTSFANPGGPGPQAATFTADRWNLRSNVDGGTTVSTAQRMNFTPGQTSVPDNPTYYIDFQGTISGGGPNSVALIANPMEDVRTLSDQRVTVSFWAKGSVNGFIVLTFGQDTGIGGSANPNPIKTFAIKVILSTDWRQYRFVWDQRSIAGVTLGTAHNLQFRLYTSAGTNFTNGLRHAPFDYPGVVSLANVQVEKGEIENPVFELLHKETIIALCQRFYCQSYAQGRPAGSGSFGSPELPGQYIFEADVSGTGGGGEDVRFPVRMRAAPSISLWDVEGNPNQASTTPAGSYTGLAILGPPTDIGNSSTGGFTVIYGATPPGAATDNWSYAFHWTANAEL